MLISPGLIYGSPRKNIMASLPGLLSWYDSVLSQPVIQQDGKIDSIYDLSGNGHHLRVRTESAKIHPTYDQNVFGSLPGIGNSLQSQKVELRGDIDIRPYTPEQQTWFFVYKSYRQTSLRILSLGSNYHNPLDHPTGLSWGRDQGGADTKAKIQALEEEKNRQIERTKTQERLLGRIEGASDEQNGPVAPVLRDVIERLYGRTPNTNKSD